MVPVAALNRPEHSGPDSLSMGDDTLEGFLPKFLIAFSLRSLLQFPQPHEQDQFQILYGCSPSSGSVLLGSVIVMGVSMY